MCKLDLGKCWSNLIHKNNHKKRNLLHSSSETVNDAAEVVIEISTKNGNSFSTEIIEKAIYKLMKDNEETIKQSLVIDKQLPCSICHNNVLKPTVMVGLCHHVFCTSCIEKEGILNKCPLCKKCEYKNVVMENQPKQFGYVMEKNNDQQKIPRFSLRFTGDWRRQPELIETLDDLDEDWDMKPC